MAATFVTVEFGTINHFPSLKKILKFVCAVQWRNSYGLRVGKPAGTRAEGAPAGCPFTLVLQLRSGIPFQKGAAFKLTI